ncbi:MAG: tripartite tricarboxylate transporter TctB family protein [Spirochaetes bacterium]|nr:tripartite tricarboxylate transporter TctB family protein [Spirochaetota bacterium]
MKKERYFSVLVLGLCAFWFLSSRSIPPATMPGAPGPKFFPYLVTGCLAVFALIQLALSFRSSKNPPSSPVSMPTLSPSEGISGERGDAEEGEEGGCVDPDDLVPDRRSLIASFLLVILYAVGIDLVGFYPATIPAVFFGLLIAMKGKTPWYKLWIPTALITASVYGVFTLALQVNLPAGKIW